MKNQFFLALIALLFFGFHPAYCVQENDSTRNFHVGIIYPVSSNGTKAASYTNRFSLHAISGVSANETGLVLSGAATIVKENANGVQISGLFNYVGNNSTGAQIAGFGNFTRHSSEGAQLSGFMNMSDTSQSQVGGFMNFNTQGSGAQIGGFANFTLEEMKGIQIAGFLNHAQEVNTQISGFINIAKKVKGTQIAGFINIADESDYPIGIVNIIKNGEKSIGLSIDETNTALTVFRSGGRILYGILGVGYNLEDQTDDIYGFEAGLGANLPITQHFRIRGELASQTLLNFKGKSYNKGILRILPALKLGNRLEIYGSPTLNRTFYETEHEHDYFGKKNIWKNYRDETWQSIHLGYTAGIQITF